MKKAAVLLLSLCAIPTGAETIEERQDREYYACTVARGASPPISENDKASCLQQAGVVDLGTAARKLTTKAWETCTIKKALLIDDGVTPAQVIAKIISDLCVSQYEAYIAALWEAPMTKRWMLENRYKYNEAEVTLVVLTARKARKP